MPTRSRPAARSLLVVVLLGLLLVDAGAGTVLAVQRHNQHERLDEQLIPARDKVIGLLKAYVDQETGVRGFVVTGDEQFLEPYVAGRREQAGLAQDLRRLLEGDAALSAGLEDVLEDGRNWTHNAAEPEITFRRAGDVTDAVALVTSGTGKVRFDRLRASVATLQADLNAEIDRVSRHTRRLADLANTVVIASAVLALVLALALSAQVQRRVLVPVRRLRGRMEAVARDPRTGPVQVPDADGDVRAVAGSAEVLRQVAVRHQDSAARARRALVQEAPSVAAITAELSPSAGALPAGLVCAGRTLPAEGEVAGDVQDVFPLTSQLVAVLVADAAGHGPHAGLVAVRAKHVLVGALRRGLGPAEALTRLSVELDDTGEGFVTVFVATVELPGGTLRYASAGHPAAVLLHAGSVQPLPPTGPLLGPVEGVWATGEATLPAQATLAVYTDGIPDTTTGAGPPYGSRRLVELLTRADSAAARSGAPLDVRAVVDSVFADLDGSTDRAAGGTRRDDGTLVVLHRPPRREERGRWVRLPAEPASAAAARRLLRDELAAVTGTDGGDLADAAQLCLTELVTNAVLHGGGSRIAVSVDVGGVVHLAVRDDSAAEPRILVHSASSGTGRGLALVASLSTRWGSDPDSGGGKVVWCEVSAESARRRGADAADPWIAELGDLLVAAGAAGGAATAGPGAPPPVREPLRGVQLLRFPVRRGMLAREHYRSVLRECQLRALHRPQDRGAASTAAAARRVVALHTDQRQADHRPDSDPVATEDALLAAHNRGERAADLAIPVEQPADGLAADVRAALAQVRRAVGEEDDPLSERTPPEVVELDEWVAQQLSRQLAGDPPTPWAGPLG